MKIKATLLVATILFGVMQPTLALANGNETTNVQSTTTTKSDSGKVGTCDWSFDQSTGTLHIGSGSLPSTQAAILPWLIDYGQSIKNITFDGKVVADAESSYLFAQLPELESVTNVQNLDVSKVVNMAGIFAADSQLRELDLSSWDTSNVESFNAIFRDDISLSKINVSNWNVEKGRDFGLAFSNDTSLTEINLSGWHVQGTDTVLFEMFENDPSLTKVNISNFDMTNITENSNYAGLFELDNSLSELTVGKGAKLDGTMLPDVPVSQSYTGKWQLVADGTTQYPDGSVVLNSSELMNQYNGQQMAGTYVWQPVAVKSADVTVKYVDENGRSIVPDVIKSGNVGYNYQTEQKSILGYTFKEVKGNVSGKFTKDAQTVTYVYSKDIAKAGNVTAKYIDEGGNNIATASVLSGNVGENYQTEQKIITGYTFKEVKGNVTGKFIDEDQTVTYVYTKNSSNTINPDDNNSRLPNKSDSGKQISSAINSKNNLPSTAAKNTILGVLIGVIVLVLIIGTVQSKKRKM